MDAKILKRFIEKDQFIISKHARIRMFERNISTDEMVGVVLNGEIIEEYKNAKPCPSGLMLGFSDGIPYHVVVAQCDDHVRIITVYKPEKERWINNRVRRSKKL